VNDDCLKLTTYFGLRDRNNDGLVADMLLDVYCRMKLETSLLLLGAEGFGLKHHLRSDLHADLAGSLPLVSIAIDTRERIEIALETVTRSKHRGLLTLEPARMLTGRVGESALYDVTKLSVYLQQQERVFGQPAFMAICDLLYRRGLAGATVLRGVDGTVRGERKRAKSFSLNAEVPVMVTIIGTGEQIGTVIPELAGLLRRPLFTLERVQVCKHGGKLLAHPYPPPGERTANRNAQQKLVIYASEPAKNGRGPIHSTLIRRLGRCKSAAGATSLPGIWGFHGDHFPHGDRLFQLRRRVPMMTTLIDTPEGISNAFNIVDELTVDRGLVTNEIVTVLR
jgi:PII-like signaling protein